MGSRPARVRIDSPSAAQSVHAEHEDAFAGAYEPFDLGSDHGACEAVYLSDPDGNGIELYWDRPAGDWPRTPDGSLALVNFPLDVDALLSAA